jgi:UDP-N-acetylmuramoyl-tripeptide--D-alanyl-D-alanine ligase
MLIYDFEKIVKLVKPVRIYNLYHFRPISGFSIDSRTIKPQEAFIALKGAHLDGHEFMPAAAQGGASLIISERDAPLNSTTPFFVVESSFEALKKICRYVRDEKNPFVYAITGSIGKTTAKEMLSFLLEDKFKIQKNYQTENNIFGVAKTIFSLGNADVLILEFGTNHPGEIKELCRMSYPDVGVITFIKPVHLEGFKDLKGVFEEKVSLLKANSKITAVLNKDDSYLRKINFCKKVYWYGRSAKNDLSARLLKSNFKESSFIIQNEFELALPTAFDNFIYNGLAAMLAASVLKISVKELVYRLNQFKEYPRSRMELKEAGGFLFLNDAYNANPYSFQETLKAVKKFSLKRVAVVGDMLELGPKSIFYHHKLAEHLRHGDFAYVLSMGTHSLHLNQRLKMQGYKNAYHFSSCDDIVDFIKKNVEKGSLIFLKGSRAMSLERVLNTIANS